ncbi:MAG: maltose ABC transporter permease MalF [Kofleriaceae bacterium]
MKSRLARLTIWAAAAALLLAALYVVALAYLHGQTLIGTAALIAVGIVTYLFSHPRVYAARYLLPGVVGLAVFVVLPLVYTVWIAFTNYSSAHILSLERATEALLSRTYRVDDESYLFTLHRVGDQVRLVLRPEVSEEEDSIFDEEPESNGQGTDDAADGAAADGAAGEDAEGAAGAEGSAEAGGDAAAEGAGQAADEAGAGGAAAEGAGDAGDEAGAGDAAAAVAFISPPFRLRAPADGGPLALTMTALPTAEPLGPALEVRELIPEQAALDRLVATLPSGVRLVSANLRTFAAEYPQYVADAQGRLTDQQTHVIFTPNHSTGYYEGPDGAPVTPGFRVQVGFTNFVRIFTSRAFRGPFLQIFAWTVSFAALSVFFTLCIGTLLAELFGWEALRFRGLYRVLLFIPYAIPSFISIQVFKGLFNQNFGEVNLLLGQLSELLGLAAIHPPWFTNAWLAKVTILIVNTWLGFPYMMLLCMGLRQSIPRDLYEASALAGAGPFTNYFKITWPLIRRPLLPLLIASFAFNFNNFVLIALLTDGRPDIVGAEVPAGTTDILVSYTYRIAFQDSGKNYALAAAISTIIFILVAALALLNLRLTKAGRSEP